MAWWHSTRWWWTRWPGRHAPDRPSEPARDDGKLPRSERGEAARATADQVSQADRDKGMLFPRQNNILETERTTATRVAESIFERGLATVKRPTDIRAFIESLSYTPGY